MPKPIAFSRKRFSLLFRFLSKQPQKVLNTKNNTAQFFLQLKSKRMQFKIFAKHRRQLCIFILFSFLKEVNVPTPYFPRSLDDQLTLHKHDLLKQQENFVGIDLLSFIFFLICASAILQPLVKSLTSLTAGSCGTHAAIRTIKNGGGASLYFQCFVELAICFAQTWDCNTVQILIRLYKRTQCKIRFVCSIHHLEI